MLTLAKNLSVLNQFTYMHLRVIITLFQKIVWFIWVTAYEMLTIKSSEKVLNLQSFNNSLTAKR